MKNKIRKFVLEQGIDDVGFAAAGRAFDQDLAAVFEGGDQQGAELEWTHDFGDG